jgi:A/G-specific adenine glycosylase
MLQQTQAPRVVGPFERFIERFPDPTACARAPLAEIVRAWSGLGYNRRAVNLHRLAREVVDGHGGAIPADLAALRALPGVGSYTARAVLVFAFDRELGLVDTNAGRFVARALAGRRVRPAEADRVADAAVPTGRAWAWGQAVFDLGALVCTRRAPACERCPIRGQCAWFRAGRPEPDPVAASAGIGRGQSRFDGSDRQGRGRLVAALRNGPVRQADLAEVMGWPGDPDRAARVAATVVADRLAEDLDDRLELP